MVHRSHELFPLNFLIYSVTPVCPITGINHDINGKVVHTIEQGGKFFSSNFLLFSLLLTSIIINKKERLEIMKIKID